MAFLGDREIYLCHSMCWVPISLPPVIVRLNHFHLYSSQNSWGKIHGFSRWFMTIPSSESDTNTWRQRKHKFYNDRKTQNSLTVGVAVLILGLVLVKVFCINWYLQTKEQCQKRKFYWKWVSARKRQSRDLFLCSSDLAHEYRLSRRIDGWLVL